jgi:hypothetical protein
LPVGLWERCRTPRNYQLKDVGDNEPDYALTGLPKEHDLLLTRKDGFVRCLRIYDRRIPAEGDIVTLPVDGRIIKASMQQ